MSPTRLVDMESLQKEKRTGVACEECRKRKKKVQPYSFTDAS